MKNFEKAFYASIGMALKGKEKVAAIAKQIAKDSEMDAKEGKVFIERAVKQAELTKKELASHVEESVKKAALKMGFVTKKEADALRAEIKKLKAKPAAKKAKK